MNKKIKIIDIFNIISKGDYEALPLNIQVDGNKYNWDNLEHFYRSRDDEDLLELARVYDTVLFLDINVEVLDNNLENNTEEIEEKSNFENMGYEIAQAYFEFYKGIEKALTEKRKESEDK